MIFNKIKAFTGSINYKKISIKTSFKVNMGVNILFTQFHLFFFLNEKFILLYEIL